MSGFKGAIQAVGEAVVIPVTDEVGKLVETGMQVVVGPQITDPKNRDDKPDPQKIAQDDAIKKKKSLGKYSKI